VKKIKTKKIEEPEVKVEERNGRKSEKSEEN